MSFVVDDKFRIAGRPKLTFVSGSLEDGGFLGVGAWLGTSTASVPIQHLELFVGSDESSFVVALPIEAWDLITPGDVLTTIDRRPNRG